MSDIADLTPAEEAEALAAELALGLLDGEDRLAAEARLASEPEFRAAFRGWTERLALLTEELTPVMAPARAKVMIDRTLGHAAPAQLEDVKEAPGRFMRWLFAAVALAAVILAVLYVPPMLRGGPNGEGAQYASELVSAERNLRVRAAIDTEAHTMRVALAEGTMPDTHDYELWWIADGEATPVSLGLVPHDGEMMIDMPAGLTRTEATVLALSEEPMGGSPTGQPTGPVIAMAEITNL